MVLRKLGGAYFVEDGNHRVSVARFQGVEWIDAAVTYSRAREPEHRRQGRAHDDPDRGGLYPRTSTFRRMPVHAARR